MFYGIVTFACTDSPSIMATTRGTFYVSCRGKVDGVSCKISTSSTFVGYYLIANCKPSTSWFVCGEISVWSTANKNGGTFHGIKMEIDDIEESAGFRADKNTFTSGKRKRDEEKLGLASIELDTEFGPYYNQVIMMQIAENNIREPGLSYQNGKDEEITALIKEKLAKGVEKLDAGLLKFIVDHQTVLYCEIRQ